MNSHFLLNFMTSMVLLFLSAMDSKQYVQHSGVAWFGLADLSCK